MTTQQSPNRYITAGANDRPRRRRSRLDRWRAEIRARHQRGDSLRTIADWLAIEHRCRVAPSTISRVLQRWDHG